MSEEVKAESAIPQADRVFCPEWKSGSAIVVNPPAGSELLRVAINPFLPNVTLAAQACAANTPANRLVLINFWFQKQKLLTLFARAQQTAAASVAGQIICAPASTYPNSFAYLLASHASTQNTCAFLELSIRADVVTMEYGELADASVSMEVSLGILQQP